MAKQQVNSDQLGIGGSSWSTWTTTLGGFSGSPIGTVKYKKMGKTVFIYADIAGTSNSNLLTFTVPFTCANTIDTTCRIMNNGTIIATPGLMELPTSSSTAGVYYDMAGSAFSPSGTKRLLSLYFTYEAV